MEIFPPPGPDRRDSFFAKTKALTERPGRLYVGLAAQGRSLKVVLLRSYLALLAAAERARLDTGGVQAPADPYMTLVAAYEQLIGARGVEIAASGASASNAEGAPVATKSRSKQRTRYAKSQSRKRR